MIAYLEPHFDELSDDSKVRLHKNPLRVLDSKDKDDQKLVADAPSILDYLSPESASHFETVKNLLKALNIDYTVDASMVRGLDYYNHTIFEIMANDKALGKGDVTVCAGGRYNGLVEELGGPETPGIGFGLGVERLLLLMQAQNAPLPAINPLDVYVVGIGDETKAETLKIVEKIRSNGFSADQDYLDRKPKAQFKTADRLNTKIVITIGNDELTNKVVNLKVMATGDEQKVKLEDVYKNFPELFGKFLEK